VTRRQGIVIAAGMVLIVALYLMRSEPQKKNPIEEQRSRAWEQLDSFRRTLLAEAEAAVNRAGNEQEKVQALKRESDIWDSLGFQRVAALYAFRTLEIDTSLPNRLNAGRKLLDAAEAGRSSEAGQNLTFFLYETAASVYEDILASDPDNPEALAGLATVEIMGRGDVMNGVQRLLGIVRKDSLNVPANLTLGRMNMVNGQYDKAIIRMNAVLKSDSLNPLALSTIAKAYVAMHEEVKAIPYLEKALKKADPELKKEIENILKKLKN